MELRPELVVAERFRLVRPLGQGGMGAVWLAHHVRLQVPCAVKFMRPEVAENAEIRARFDREAIAAAQLRSPHVVQTLDHGVWEGMPYIAMEYLEGEDLDQRLRRRGKLTPEETMAIVAQVARALSKAHTAGLVHRDLKPPNIFLTRDDDRELVKVLDFGVAKTTAPEAGGHTKTGAILGTPYYMSPEQAQGTKSVDLRTDLWALGVVTYQCLTGTLPFLSDAFGDLVLKIIVEPLPVPSQVAPVPPGFDAWWARAMQRDPAARFQSAKELADALMDALGLRGVPMLAASVDAPPLGSTTPLHPSIPDRSSTPDRSLAAGAVSTAGEKAPAKRSGALVTAGLAAAALLAVGAFVVLRGSAPAHGVGAIPASSPASSASVAPAPAATTPAAPAVPEPVPEAAASSPKPQASAEPTVAPRADTAPAAASAAPGGSARAGAPPGTKRGAGKPAGGSQPRDIGF